MNKEAALEALYAEVPDVDCMGLCHRSCGPIRMTNLEHDRIQQRHGVDIPTTGLGMCPALTILNRCGVYEDRPLVCRLWGVVESLPCPWGCRPAAVLPDQVGHRLIARAQRIDGGRS